jgi:glycine cleavage system H protein
MLKYTSDHEWIFVENDSATIGITAFAQEKLGDLVFVQLPKVGTILKAGGAAAIVESVKAASDVYAPINGEVIGINEQVIQNPTLVNTDPAGKGWLFKVKVTDQLQLDNLLDEPAYHALIAEAH